MALPSESAETQGISIHALLAEIDPSSLRWTFCLSDFYPRSPRGDRHHLNAAIPVILDISIHALLAEIDYIQSWIDDHYNISIHALLAEIDELRQRLSPCHSNFYPRSPRGDRRMPVSKNNGRKRFLSTLSSRRSTSRSELRCQSGSISIHALLAEIDRRRLRHRPRPSQFLSTLSSRRSTQLAATQYLNAVISIHALLAEIDIPGIYNLPHFTDFYPRSPRGDRRVIAMRTREMPVISIHALLAEIDL